MGAKPTLQPLEAPEHATHNPQPGPSLRLPISGMATASGDQATASTSASAPEIHTERSLSASPIAASPSYNPAPSTSSLSAKPESYASVVDVELPDPQILEALKNKDRIYVLKLGELMEALIIERGARIELSPVTSYQRLLVYRCSTYYKLAPEKDPVGKKTITVYCRSESRIPARRLCELVPAEESAQPAFQIMRRTDRNLRGRQYSHPSSTAGEDADTSDVDASEAGSVGGVSSAASTGARRYKTMEEREAEYKEARSRIFMSFEDKKEKEKDMSANSSTFSLVSGSGSTSGGRGSSIGDLDDSASSAPTESEWSGPVTRDKWDVRRGPGSTNSSVRSLRSSGASFNANGSGPSSRNSRATSPSFSYPSLHDPASGPPFEQGQYGNTQPPPPPPPGYVTHYPYPPYQPPPSGQQYMTPYYYPPYNYPPPAAHSDPTTPGGPEVMYIPPHNPSQQPSYGSPYVWSNVSSPGPQPLSPPHLQPQPQPQHPPQPGMPPAHLDGHSPGHPMLPPIQPPPQYPQYAPGPAPYGYSMPGYFQQPYQPSVPMGHPPPPMPGQIYHPGPIPDSMGPHVHAGNGIDGPNISRASSRNSTGHNSVNGKRGGPRARGSWTYGPGVGTPGFNYNLSSTPNGMSANDAYGPRLSTNMRRQSGTSSSGSAGTRTPADETSSTASSSTTSSSSRRTFTSTSTSSKHPLPARPDWAVGLKPQHPRHHDHHTNAASRTMSPARMSGGSAHLPPQQHQAQAVLQPNDFPPLSSGPSTRQPVVGGAWTNASMSRVMMPAPQGNTNAQGSALVHYPNSQTSSPQAPPAPAPAAIGRLDEQDPVFERPPPKNAELFNPKAGGRVGGNGGRVENGRSWADTGASVAAGLTDKLNCMVLADAEAIGHDVLPPGYGASTGESAVAIVAGEGAMASS
ncbi:hypothetical protein LXA43DRAFT_1000793 [Ganoderma leucocontextum]|nr:hypothetical protein LXA43DRAFT_1000793 [Ganoderma leucocontextum]